VKHSLWLPLVALATGCGNSSAVQPVAAVPAKADAAPLAVSKGALSKNPVKTEAVRKEKLAGDLMVVGSVSFDQNHYAVVGPLVDGRVIKLRANVGDRVRSGQTLAEVESADVGQAQAAYLTARARLNAAEANLNREKYLTARRISSQREREVAEAQALSERAEIKAATERLRAFGLGDAEIKALEGGANTGGRVPLKAPISGTVVERLVTLGQAVQRADDAFKLVNLDHLWVLLDLYEKDLRRVHVGQKVELRTEARPGEVFQASLAYINPIIDEKTRTAHIRIEFDNPQGKLSPGQFVSAKLLGDPKFAPVEGLAVPRAAVQTVDGKSLVFVKKGEGFEKRLVEVGVSGGEMLEIKRGLEEGEEVATEGAFLLKSELLR
jgi:cobalt-zinc-cadmium efflux system membrane fusion protein